MSNLTVVSKCEKLNRSTCHVEWFIYWTHEYCSCNTKLNVGILFGTSWKFNFKNETKIPPPWENQHKLVENQEIMAIWGLTFHVTTELLQVMIRHLTQFCIFPVHVTSGIGSALLILHFISSAQKRWNRLKEDFKFEQ